MHMHMHTRSTHIGRHANIFVAEELPLEARLPLSDPLLHPRVKVVLLAQRVK